LIGDYATITGLLGQAPALPVISMNDPHEK
jgi:hypothetical protein